MENKDEEILKIKKELKELEEASHSKETIEQELKGSIYDESLNIFKVKVKFKAFRLLNEHISLMMPEDFELMPDNIIKMIHPIGNTPQYLYGNEYLPFSIGFNATEHTIADGSLSDFINFAQNTLTRVGPNIKIIKRENFMVDEYHIETLQMTSHALDGVQYNVMFYFSLNNKLQIGFINMPYQYSNRLKSVAQEIIHSLHFIKEGE